ncbi:MAG: signal peptidase I [Pirellulales bacterium]|nr:signal peptidase I [Pirellulales bacterium]
MDEPKLRKRSPWIAALLSVFCTGLGHIYCGRIVMGLGLFAASTAFVPFQTSLLLFGYSAVLVFITVVLGLVSIVVSLYAVISSFVLARRLGADYRLKEYNHPIVYLAFFLIVGFIAPTSAAQVLRENVAEAFSIAANSMAPNFLKGDLVLADKQAYRNGPPQRGDVIVFRNPMDRKMNYIKRVVGLPGDRVEVREGVVYLDGKPLPQKRATSSIMGPAELPEGAELFEEHGGDRAYLIAKHRGPSEVPDFAETEVPPGHVFVLGDNRDRSLDSRRFGCVPIGDIKGRATFLYWPAGRWSRFGRLP